MAKPIVAIVGRPNVGKSQLFNRLAGKRLSIVEDTPGVTRDRLYADSDWRGRDFTVIDTGGIDPHSDDVLLSQMRRQAEARQREMHSDMAERTATNEAIDQALKHVFFFLHELVQQLNIVKPGIPRNYALIEQYVLSQLDWQEGFADYRTQSQSAGALVELATFSYHLKGSGSLLIERDGAAVERFRTTLFEI